MPMATIPGSFADLLAGFRGCFTTPTFTTFTALCGGLLAQPGRPAGRKVGSGHCWVVAGILVQLPFIGHRHICLPVLARL
jgi:hypothetical protein